MTGPIALKRDGARLAFRAAPDGYAPCSRPLERKESGIGADGRPRVRTAGRGAPTAGGSGSAPLIGSRPPLGPRVVVGGGRFRGERSPRGGDRGQTAERRRGSKIALPATAARAPRDRRDWSRQSRPDSRLVRVGATHAAGAGPPS